MTRERATSRATTRDGKNSTHQRTYRLLTQTNDSLAAMTELLAALPNEVIVDGITLDQIAPTIEPLGAGWWSGEGTFRHKASANAESQNENLAEIDDTEISLNFGTETIHITEALEQTKYNVGATTAPDVEKTIGDLGDDITGVDILAPAGDFTITKVFDGSVTTDAWIRERANKRCHTNSDPFFGYEVGELLFVRFALLIRNSGDTTVTYSFSQRQNETSLDVAGATGVDKKAHDYLWVRYEKEEDTTAKRMVSKAEGVYVAQVYPETTFTDLL